jgi:hypothetical protein
MLVKTGFQYYFYQHGILTGHGIFVSFFSANMPSLTGWNINRYNTHTLILYSILNITILTAYGISSNPAFQAETRGDDFPQIKDLRL